MITLYVVEDTIPPRIVSREARETAKMYVISGTELGLDVPRSLRFKRIISKAAFTRCRGAGLSAIEATESWVEHRKGCLKAAHLALGRERAAVNAALKLRNETQDAAP